MRTTYVFRNGKHVDVRDLPADDPYFAPRGGMQIISDTPGYVSPVSGKWVDGRAARREDLKATGCREVDPGERKTFLG